MKIYVLTTAGDGAAPGVLALFTKEADANAARLQFIRDDWDRENPCGGDDMPLEFPEGDITKAAELIQDWSDGAYLPPELSTHLLETPPAHRVALGWWRSMGTPGWTLCVGTYKFTQKGVASQFEI